MFFLNVFIYIITYLNYLKKKNQNRESKIKIQSSCMRRKKGASFDTIFQSSTQNFAVDYQNKTEKYIATWTHGI